MVKNMKKGIAFILTAVLLLTGCGSTSAPAGTQEKVEATQEAEVTQEASAAGEEAPEDTAEDVPQQEADQPESEQQEPAATAEMTDPAAAEEAEAGQEGTEASADTLVIYFSRTGEQYEVGVIDKGNTAIVAEMIATCSRSCLWTTTTQ